MRLVRPRFRANPPGREHGRGRRRQIGQGGHDHRAANSHEAHEDPRRDQGAHARTGHVQAVEEAQPRSGIRRRRWSPRRGPGRAGTCPSAWWAGRGSGSGRARPTRACRRGRPHGRRAGRGAARGWLAPKRPDAELQKRESGEGAARIEPHQPGPAQLAARAQAGQERGHDHGHRVEADAAAQGEHPLPGHLIDEGGGAAQEESEPDHRERIPRRGDPHPG